MDAFLRRMLSSQAGCPSLLSHSSSPAGVRCFPQRVWTTRWSKHWRLLGHSRRGLPRQRHGAAPAGPASLYRCAVESGGGSRTNGQQGTPVCAAARGPVSAAAETAPPLDYPRAPLGSQATFRPPVGSATHSNRRCALPPLAAPQGAHMEGTGAAALCPCHCFLSPLHPLTGALRIATAPACRRLCRPCRCLWRLSRAALSVLPTGESPCHRGAGLLGLLLSLYFPGSLHTRLAMYCRRAPASRPGLATRTSRTATAIWPPAKAVWRARRASVLADRGRRHCACRGTGGARACRTRRGRGRAGSVGAPCPQLGKRKARSSSRFLTLPV